MFLAGNLSYPEYADDRIPRAYSLLNRREFVNAIRREFPELITTASNEVRGGTCNFPISMIDQAIDGLCMPEYFLTLERSDFLLCPPGVNHPHYHNIFEGMSRGVIPVLEYAHLMRPAMQDSVNCISFRGRDGLIAAVHRVLSMPAAELNRIRRSCLEYFDKFCTPASVIRRICDADIKRIRMLNESESVPRTPQAAANDETSLTSTR